MVTKEEIEAKAREIEATLNETRESAKNTAVMAGLGVVAAIGFSFLVGRRKGKASKTKVRVFKVR